MYEQICACTRTGSLGKGMPATFAMDIDVINEFLIFLLGPSSLVRSFPITAWLPHFNPLVSFIQV